jgi:H+-transporting ATPase
MLELTALGLIVLSSGKDRPPDWPTCLVIILILCLNAAAGVCAERRAFGGVSALIQSTFVIPDFKVKAQRSGSWLEIDASQLVRGDIITLKSHDTVPADCRVINISDSDALSVDADEGGAAGNVPVNGRCIL